jgi:HK97 family phage major capsid protein
MTLQELEEYFSKKMLPEMEQAITTNLRENIQSEIETTLGLMGMGNIGKPTQKAHFNPGSGYLNGKPKTAEGMDDYMNENYGVQSVQNKTFKGMFGNNNLSSGGFDTFGEFLKLIDSGLNDSRLVKAPSGANEGIPTDGGFLTPDEHTARVFDVALESEIIRPLATVFPMKSKTMEIPAMELTNHSTALYGNVEMKWSDEGGTVTGVKPAFRAMHLTAHKARIDLMATNELLADSSPNYETIIGKVVTSTFAYGLDNIFLNGHGGGQPLGILNAPCLITVAAETNQTASTIVWENIVNMYARMHPACVGNAVWVASITAIPQLMTLYFTVGTGGVPVPALREDSGKFYLVGKRVFITEKLPVLGQVGDIMMCDFSQYAVGMRQELRIEKSNSPGWSTDESAWRCIVRIDGQPLWDRVLTLKDGVTTVSPFITLAERS